MADPKRDNDRGVKSYDAPSTPARGGNTGRIISIVVIVVLAILLLLWLF